jgi:uncharacterized protein YqhQ
MSKQTENKKTILVGGQAVMEGVMMRTPKAYATAVRNPQGEIITERKEFTSLAKKNKFYAWPIVRGVVSMVESMKIGMETLNFSADIAFPEESKKRGRLLVKGRWCIKYPVCIWIGYCDVFAGSYVDHGKTFRIAGQRRSL